MQLVYVQGKLNPAADALSRRPDYEPIEVPLAQEPGVQHTAIDVLLEECFKALSRGRPVAEQKCPSCQISLPYEATRQPGRYGQVTKTICKGCGAEVKYPGFHSPLGRFDPSLQRVEGALGIFVPMKGPGLLPPADRKLEDE